MSKGTREKIIKAATTLFAQEGYHYVSLAKVAALAGVGPTTIYNHFLNKEELLEAVLEEGWKTLESKLQDNLKDPLGPKEKFIRIISTTLEFAKEEPEMMSIMIVDFCQPYSHIEKFPNRLSSPSMEKISKLIESVLEEGKEAGEFKTFQNVHAARSIIVTSLAGCIYGMERRKWLKKKELFGCQDVITFMKSIVEK